MSKVTLEEARRAVSIAARIMQAAGLCRYDSITKCGRFCPAPADCDRCIEKWLLAKAKKEIKAESEDW